MLSEQAAPAPLFPLFETYLQTFVAEDIQAADASKKAAPFLTDLKKREILADLLFKNEHSSHHNSSFSDIIQINLLNDLNFVNTKESLFNQVNKTKTTAGEISLLMRFAQPTTDQAVIVKRQQLLQELIQNKEAYAAIQEQLTIIKENEDAFLKLWEKEDSKVSDLFFKKKFLTTINNNSYATSFATNTQFAAQWVFAHLLDTQAWAELIKKNEPSTIDEDPGLKKILKGAAAVAQDFFVYHLNPKNLYKGFELIQDNYKEHYGDVKREFTRLLSTSDMNALYDNLQNDLLTKNEYRKQVDETWLKHENNYKTKIIAHAPYALNVLIATYLAYIKLYFYYNQVQRKQIVNGLQTQLSQISAILNAVDQIKKISDEQLHANIKQDEVTQECQSLIDQLKSSTFSDASQFYFEGRVLSCYYKIKQLKEQFANVFAYVGLWDSYVAIAELLQTQTEKAPMCFAQFCTSDNASPMIVNKDFWNLFIAPNKVVTNNLTLDGFNVILTGPNAGGKSTAIKALLQNILLAQTFGIATGSKFVFTPFSKIASYLNIVDNLANGKSLFQAEVERAKNLLELVTNLPTNQYIFCAIDELFTGTSAEAGEQCAFSLVDKLGSFRNSMFVFATHYPLLTSLEQKNAAAFVNYKVNAPTKVDGKLVYPFTLAQGINEVNVAMDMLQEHNILG